MFLCEFSMTLCLVYKTKSSEQSSDTIRDAIKNKLSTYSLRWDPSDICTKTWTNCSNQKRQSERSFTPFVRLMMDSSAWTVSEKKSEHMKASETNTHLYTVCRQDSGSECNFYLFLMRRNTRIQHDQVSAVKRLNTSGRSLWWEEDYSSMSCSGGVFMQMFVPGDVILHLRSKRAVFGA